MYRYDPGRILATYYAATQHELDGDVGFFKDYLETAKQISDTTGLDLKASTAVIAVLSPMNTWEGNKYDAVNLSSKRDWPCRASKVNVDKAIRILDREDPDKVVTGPKVRDFWLGSLDEDYPRAPIDRHLYRCIYPGQLTAHKSIPKSKADYELAISTYQSAANLLNVKVRHLAAAVWGIMRDRNLWRSGPIQIPIPSGLIDPICCYSPVLRKWGKSYGRQRWNCLSCGKHVAEGIKRCRNGMPLPREAGMDEDGRVIMYLGRGHEYANKSGLQYRYRYRVMDVLGRRLHTNEEVDHVDKDNTNDSLYNLRVLLKEDHMTRHGNSGREIGVIAEWVGDIETGSFIEYDEPRMYDKELVEGLSDVPF